jgi:hypothetical protein
MFLARFCRLSESVQPVKGSQKESSYYLLCGILLLVHFDQFGRVVSTPAEIFISAPPHYHFFFFLAEVLGVVLTLILTVNVNKVLARFFSIFFGLFGPFFRLHFGDFGRAVIEYYWVSTGVVKSIFVPYGKQTDIMAYYNSYMGASVIIPLRKQSN